MREIKFRGKRSNDNEWIYGSLININVHYHILSENDMVEDGHHIRQDSDVPTWVEENTIGQFTGLKDKNGTDIYDGDILKDSDGVIICVRYCEYKAYYVAEILNPENYMIDILAGYPTDDFEVIGNEYDNKELLKGE